MARYFMLLSFYCPNFESEKLSIFNSSTPKIMKTNLRKYALIGALALALPFTGFAQSNYDESMQPADPGDTNVSQQDQQMDQQEAQQVAPPDTAPQTTQTFYNELSPYGQWVDMPNYGYVWIPNAGVGFVPYSNYGHWVYTEYGWTWVSDYSWGWAPFHYGRWNYDAGYGWYWIPDIYWGPAWVAWRHCDGYYGWAPLGPGMNITVGYTGDYGIASAWWVFVGESYICDRYVYRHYESRRNCDYFYHHSTIVYATHYDDRHHIAYAGGPDRHEVEAVTHQPVRQVAVRATAKPGQRYDNAHLHTYKPEIQPAERTSPRPQPTRYVPVQQVPRRDAPQPARQQYSAPARSYSAPQSVPQRSNGGSRPMPTPVRSGGGGGGGRHR